LRAEIIIARARKNRAEVRRIFMDGQFYDLGAMADATIYFLRRRCESYVNVA